MDNLVYLFTHGEDIDNTILCNDLEELKQVIKKYPFTDPYHMAMVEIMPTGYTDNIKEGITFKDFALQCSRSFDALINMRDELFDAPIKYSEPSDYNKKQIERLRTELDKLCALSTGEIEQLHDKEYTKELLSWESNKLQIEKLLSKYNIMIKNVRKWIPPTKEHDGLKKFMIEQIEESIRFDCTIYDKPQKTNVGLWFSEKKESLQKSIDYNIGEDIKEIQRTNKRNQWIKKLIDSL